MVSPKKHLPYIELLFVTKVCVPFVSFRHPLHAKSDLHSPFCCACTGFSEIMATLSKIGFFDAANHPLLQDANRPTYKGFLDELLNADNISTITTNLNIEASGGYDDELIARILSLGHCKEKDIAVKTVKTIKLVQLPCYQISLLL